MEIHSVKNVLDEFIFIEKIAYDKYHSFYLAEPNESIKKFWENMFRAEVQHINHWRKLLDLNDNSEGFVLFDEIEKVYEEVVDLKSKIIKIAGKKEYDENHENRMIMTFYLECYMLNPLFERLFTTFNLIFPEESIEKDYDKHINEFIYNMNSTIENDSELLLLGKVLLELWEKNREVINNSTKDFLTEIYNKKTFFEIANILGNFAKRHNLHVGMLMIDIDKFKDINDKFGHHVGDVVLKNVAQSIQKSVRSSDIVGRYGGEEIIVFLSDITEESLYTVAEKIRAGVENDTKESIAVTVSIGAASGELKGKLSIALLTLLETSDTKMYVSKKNGRNRVS